VTDDRTTALRRAEISFVYQFDHLLPEFSTLQNLVLPQPGETWRYGANSRFGAP
jgi:ABC-type lipoprotein export system ATPase subunit